MAYVVQFQSNSSFTQIVIQKLKKNIPGPFAAPYFFLADITTPKINPSLPLIVWNLVVKFIKDPFISSPGQRPGELLPSLGVQHRRLSLTIFQNSSPLTLLDQLEPHLVWMFLRVCCIELMKRFFICRNTWPPLLKIERRVQSIVVFNILPKSLGFVKFWHGVKAFSKIRSISGQIYFLIH